MKPLVDQQVAFPGVQGGWRDYTACSMIMLTKCMVLDASVSNSIIFNLSSEDFTLVFHFCSDLAICCVSPILKMLTLKLLEY